MNILLIHPSFPGQFEYLTPFLARNASIRAAFLCRSVDGPVPEGVIIKKYRTAEEKVAPINATLREAEAVIAAMKELEETFRPDVVLGHSGWGGLMYVKAFFPYVRLIGYFEWYFGMLPEFEGVWYTGMTPEEREVLFTQRNAALLAQLESCDAWITPTEWQRSRFPVRYRPDMRVIHEGVDTEYYSPLPGQTLEKLIPGLTGGEEIVTCVSRGLEPTRCFPILMDALRLLLARRPHCHAVIAGGEKTFYGPKPKDGKTWKQMEMEKGGYDPDRVHFTGWLSKEDYRALLRASTVHAYLTVPYVLSWSVLQAMSAGCCLVASAVPPVEEVVQDGVNGLLTDGASPEKIAERIEEALTNAPLRERLGCSARQTILDRYRLENCLRKQMELLCGKE